MADNKTQNTSVPTNMADIEIPDEILNLPEKGSASGKKKNTKKKSKSAKTSSLKEIKGSGMLHKFILITAAPMILLAILAGILSYNLSLNHLLTAKQQEMDSIAKLALSYYDTLLPGNYTLIGDNAYDLCKGNEIITTRYDLVDDIRSMTGMEISLIYKDTRVLTTVTDKNKARAIGSGIVPQVKEKLMNSKEGVFFRDTLIDGVGYYSYYLPIVGADGIYTGAIELCCPHSTLLPLVWRITCPVVLSILAVMIVLIVLAINNYKGIVLSFRQLLSFTQDAASGNDAAELDSSVLRRNDEISSIASSVLEMHRSLRDMMDKDALTKLYNRRSANRKLDRIRSHFKQQNTPYSVSIGDIDFFKKVNDNYGHEAGDIVLQQVANILNNYMKSYGFVARWGGEEFLLVFDKIELKEAEAHLEKILDSIRALSIDYNGQTIKVTMSFGVVCAPELSQDEVISAADTFLYYSKEHGRNRITSHIDS